MEDEIIKDVVCPLCGGQIKKTSFGYGCVNYKGDEPGSCRFSVGQIADVYKRQRRHYISA